MANILSASEAANVLRCAEDDPAMLDLLPLVDGYINDATGWDWTVEYPDTALSQAKAAARILLVQWYEDPGRINAGGALGLGFNACITQLKALGLELAENEESA